jgi:hypothetical protein
MLKTRASVLAFAIVVLGAATFAADDAQPVRFDRAIRPNEAYDIHCLVEESNSISGGRTDDAPKTTNESTKMELFGRISGATQGPDGNIEQCTIAITKLTKDGRDQIRPGTIVKIKIVDKRVKWESSDVRAVPDNAKPVLMRLFPAFIASGKNDNDALGSIEPRKTGDSWKVNPEAMAKCLESARLTVQPFNIQGTVELDSTDAVKGQHIVANVTFKDFTADTLPKGIFMQESKAKSKFVMQLPPNPKAPPLEVESIMDATAQVANLHSTAKATLQMHAHHLYTMTPVAPTSEASAKPATK